MKRLLVGAALAVAAASLATPATAKAETFCSSGLALNFCGSVTVEAVSDATGTQITFKITNLSGGSFGGNPAAFFTAIGLEGVPGITDATTFTNFIISQGGTMLTGWDVEANKSVGGGINVDILSSTTTGANYGISSACSGAANLLYTGGIGGCPINEVTISFRVNQIVDITNADIFVKAQGGGASGECVVGGACQPVTITAIPEPASVVLFGTGLAALGGRMLRRRRKGTEEADSKVA